MTTATTERIVSAPVKNPDTGGTGHHVKFMGKVDLLQRDGRKLTDWKTTSKPIDDVIQQLDIRLQPYLYALALLVEGIEIEEVCYRIMQVPSIRFCSKDNGDSDAYEQRCVEWFKTDMHKHTRDHSLILVPSRIDEARRYLWNCHQRILENRRTGCWLKNEQACRHYERMCPYADLCETQVHGGDLAWAIENGYEAADLHPELNGTSGNVLTFTSMGTLTLCEQKYFWRYEEGLKKRHEASDALWTGSAVHTGLDAYASGGRDAADAAIDEWAKANPVISTVDGVSNEHKTLQDVARARVMVRVAAARWRDG